MSATELSELLNALGVTAALAASLGAWLGKVVSERIARSERKADDAELARLRAELDRANAQAERVSAATFTIYNELWSRLQDLHTIADRLWESPSRDAIQEFIETLAVAKLSANRGRLLLREDDYRELLTVLGEFENYRLGKQRLIEIRSETDLASNFAAAQGRDIADQLAANGAMRQRYKTLLDDIAKHFREQLKIAA